VEEFFAESGEEPVGSTGTDSQKVTNLKTKLAEKAQAVVTAGSS